MEADERAAADRNAGRSAGHHIVIAGPVVALVVPNGAHDGQLVGHAGQPFHVLRILDARHLGVDRLEFTPYFFRSLRLGIERFVMRRPAIHPDQDAASFGLRSRLRSRGVRREPQEIDKARAQRRAEAELQCVATGQALAVTMDRHVYSRQSNTKYEARNTKQNRNSKHKCPKQFASRIRISQFVFVSYFELRISCFPPSIV